jgi:hypothetical protein
MAPAATGRKKRDNQYFEVGVQGRYAPLGYSIAYYRTNRKPEKPELPFLKTHATNMASKT